MKVTSEVIKTTFMGEDLVIPKGTRITNETACGYDDNYNFIDEFSWYKPELKGFAREMALHDMIYRGIDVPKNKVKEV